MYTRHTTRYDVVVNSKKYIEMILATWVLPTFSPPSTCLAVTRDVIHLSGPLKNYSFLRKGSLAPLVVSFNRLVAGGHRGSCLTVTTEGLFTGKDPY